MRPLRYSIHVTLDGCCDHSAMDGDLEMHRRGAESLARADALIFGRVTYGMMESAWRPMAANPGSLPEETRLFAQTIDKAKKYVVSNSLKTVDWNAEILRGDLGQAVEKLKQSPGDGLFVGGVKLPMALAELNLIDEYELVVHPRLAGRGPYLFAGLPKPLDVRFTGKTDWESGATAMRYEPAK
ncbi:dihydrofolate reductase family protein [Micromonospora sp. RP3T]|uniref:dihydrofolate reductase family protein n=1 Tax=Micromonospora sp. RP3T TaxID=2135446 RepID=UPI000D17D016|nr:dihydrofolate reductase family protein [Micromonospora sp. RP3T]PTA47940.1 deaminase [Micromonospora sp. RP3T]